MRQATRSLVMLLLTLALTASAVPAFAAGPMYGARIYNGDSASQHSFPNVALIMFESGSRCTGSLIAPEWVLTAAHCIPKAQSETLRIGLGGDDISAGFDEVYSSTSYAAHPAYNDQTYQYDAGLIRLPQRSMKPLVQLASREDRAAWQPGVAATIVGWGRVQDEPVVTSSILRSATVIIQEESRCHEDIFSLYDEGTMMCAGGAGSDACKGDSGGPLVVFSGSNVVQMGITSYGEDCGAETIGYYAWVPEMRTWIDATIGAQTATAPAPTPVVNQPATPVVDQPVPSAPSGGFEAPSSGPAAAPHSSRVRAVVSDSRIRRGDTIRVRGAVLPQHRGEVTLKRLTARGWKGIKKATLNANSRYVFRGVKPGAGTTMYRVVMPAHGNHAKVVSPVRIVVAR